MKYTKEAKRNLGKIFYLVVCAIAVGLVNWIALLPFIFGYVVGMLSWKEES